MKFRILIACSLGILLSATGRAQFEGAIDMKMTVLDQDTSQVILYSMLVKKDMMAARVKSTEENTQNGSFVFRRDKKLLWIINDDEQQYVEIALNDSLAALKSDSQPPSSKPKLRKTGKKQTLLGYTCDEWKTESEGKTTTIWGTSKLGNLYEGLTKSFGEMSGMKNTAAAGWEEELASKKIFPLKIVSSKDGVVTDSQEVTKVEARLVPMSAFEPPSGYTKQSLDVDMETLMKQLQEQMKQQSETPDSSEH